MTNTKAWIAAGTGSATLLAAIFHMTPYIMTHDADQYLGWAVTAPRETVLARPIEVTLEERVATLLPTLESADPGIRRSGLNALSGVLKESGKGELADDIRDELAGALTRAAGEEALRTDAVKLLMVKLQGPVAKEFAMGALDSEDAKLRDLVLETVTSHGAMRDKEVFAKAFATVHKEGVPEKLKPGAIRRALPKKEAAVQLSALIESTGDQETLRRSVVEIQNLHKPELLGPALSRMEKLGMLQDNKGLPWFSGAVLAKHIETADGDDLVRALRLVWLKPGLTRHTAKTVEARMAHADPAIRRIVARLIPDAVKYEGMQSELGEQVLSARLAVETDPAVKGEIEESLSQVRQARHSDPETAPITP